LGAGSHGEADAAETRAVKRRAGKGAATTQDAVIPLKWVIALYLFCT
jgi:hypothetical protein